MPTPSQRELAVRSVVVVGAGLAGAQTVAALRDQGFDGRITLIGGESRAPYDRPPLSKHLLDRTEPAWLTDELGVDVLALADDVRLATAATHLTVRPDGVTVATALDTVDAERVDADTVDADAVVIATGSRALRPALWSGAVTLQTADDAAALRARLRPGARLVIVGAGWIGAEVAGVVAATGIEVTVVEAAPSPLAAALGAVVGALTTPWYRAAGVRLLTGIPAAEVRADGVRLADGSELPADVVLAAVGARPATAWLGSLPREPDGSLVVDAGYRVVGAHGQVHARVHAVGDVARRRSARHGWVPGGHWDGALRSPGIAVRALLGGPGVDPRPDDDFAPYVFSTQLGHELAMFGLPTVADHINHVDRARDEVRLRGDPRGDPRGDGGWTALWFSPAGELTGLLAVDRPRDVAAARRLFAAATLPRLDPAIAADPSRPLRDAVR
ncbi:NAD(P)/FAD-dependent oxidoreductase [Pengzhenrongella phosphoraccumulans]|uniref:NAD(P)/FAD-dependent oxidoreductase n=1 Tax=Pengzhenrongella phosphoraccumulans TaxID=3114394 RepID=UPI00388FAC8A